MATRFVVRIRVITILTCLVVLVIIGRLYYLQVLKGPAYAARADAQFTQPASPLMDRAAIYFTDKSGTQIVGATLATGYALAVNPKKVTDVDALYEAVKEYTPLTRDEFLAKAQKKGSQYQRIATHLSDALSDELRSITIPGLIVEQDRWRLYPGGSLAAHALGFVAYNGDVEEGRYGLERYYERNLNRPTQDLYGNFFVTLFGSVQSVVKGEAQSGDIITTIDPGVQAELERTLVQYGKEWHPRLSGGIIMDPKTGEIVAMAVNPTFDVNEFQSQKNAAVFSNPMVESVYEMGSIIKPLTMAAGIDSRVITATTTYNDTGCITPNQKRICNFDGKARGVVPMQQILSQSLNLGVSFIAGRMGSTTMREYFLNRYKLGEETGIDLPAEGHGLLQNTLNSTREVEYDTASFGQGIALTPIATARALATLANGGRLVTPHLARSIHYDTGITKTLGWGGEGEEVLRPETAAAVAQMLTEVVDKELAHGAIKLERYSVAAKTGTAQIANPAGGGYYADRYLHSFFGFFPSYNARFIVFLFAVEPTGAQYASETWASPFHTLTKFLINYYDIPPDR